MFMAISALGIILFVTMPYAVELYEVRVRVFFTDVQHPNLASAADEMNALITCSVLWIASLLGGKVVLCDKKKYPLALFCTCGSLK